MTLPVALCERAGTMAYMAPELRNPSTRGPAGGGATALNARALDIHRCSLHTEPRSYSLEYPLHSGVVVAPCTGVVVGAARTPLGTCMTCIQSLGSRHR